LDLEGGQFCPQPAFQPALAASKAAAAKIGRPPKSKLAHYWKIQAPSRGYACGFICINPCSSVVPGCFLPG